MSNCECNQRDIVSDVMVPIMKCTKLSVERCMRIYVVSRFKYTLICLIFTTGNLYSAIFERKSIPAMLNKDTRYHAKTGEPGVKNHLRTNLFLEYINNVIIKGCIA